MSPGPSAGGPAPRVLLAHDCGEGLGHAGRLIPLAQDLRAAGGECLIGVRNPETVVAGLKRAGLPFVQAPYTYAVDRPLLRAGQDRGVSGWTDLLATHGFDLDDQLAGWVGAWDALLDLFRPDLVVADFAPFLSLAVRGRCPVIQVGNGWTLPPVLDGRLPRLLDDGEPWLPDAAFLDPANALQRRRGRPELASLGDLLAAEASFVTVLPLLDPYAALRPQPAAGPLEPLPPPAGPPPATGWFAYLSAGYAGTEAVLEGLLPHAATGSVYLRDAAPEAVAAWRAKGLAVHDRPVALAATIAAARAVVHHGGPATAQVAAALGRPQLLVPRHLEHVLNAAALGRQGAAIRLKTRGRFEPGAIAEGLRLLLAESRFADAAAALAERIAAAGAAGSRARIVRACLAVLGRG